MLSWDDSQTLAQYFANDSSADTLTKLKILMNLGYKYVLAELNRPVTEKTGTLTTVASQQYYKLPPDYLFLKTATITVGGKAYSVIEEESQEYWDRLNLTTQTNDIPTRFFIRHNFGLFQSEIGFYPIPSSASNTITVVYEATDKDLSVDTYTTGTITLTNADATVAGSATTFTAAMVGRYLRSTSGDGLWYRIDSFTSTVSIELETNYAGTTTAGLSYEIEEAFNLPEEIQILPVYYAMSHYYANKKDAGQEAKYIALFDKGMILAKQRWGTKTRGGVIRGKSAWSRWPIALPNYFPTEVT